MTGLEFTEDPATSVALQGADFLRWVSNIDRVSSEPWVISQGFGCLQHAGVYVSRASGVPL